MSGSAHEFFAAAAGVAGALVGLLFVAISVAPERVIGPEASEVHAVRATAALTSFTNTLTVSLFQLVPGLSGSGGAPTAVAIIGLLFVLSTLVRLGPARRAGTVRLIDMSFLLGLVAVFVVQLIAALELDGHTGDHGALQTICILVIVCFLIGIDRAWELLGGPRIGLFSVLAERRAGSEETRSQRSESDA